MELQVDNYLEELFRPKNQVEFIKNVKKMYNILLNIENMDIRLSDNCRYIFTDIIKFLEKMEGDPNDSYSNDIEDKWYNNQKYRKEMYRKYKIHISAIIKKKMRSFKKDLPRIKKGMAEFVKKQKELQTYIDDNSELAKQMKTRWYNIFGGPQGSVKRRGEWSKETADSFEDVISGKLNPLNFAAEIFSIKFIMGLTDSYGGKNAELFFKGDNNHNHFLIVY